MFKVELDLSEYHRAKRETLRDLDDLRYKVVGEASRDGVKHARAGGKFKNRTGELRGTIRTINTRASGRSVWGGFEAPAKHASFLEHGTKPHVILPLNYGVKRGRPISRVTGKRTSVPYGVGRGHALRFYMNGRVVFAKRVNHPGTKPDPFMQPASIVATLTLIRKTNEGIERISKRYWRSG